MFRALMCEIAGEIHCQIRKSIQPSGGFADQEVYLELDGAPPQISIIPTDI